MCCISLTVVTIVVGFLSQNAQRQVSNATLGIYDNAFQSMNYLRSAQSIILGISRDLAARETGKDVVVDQLQSAMDALDVTQERAMSVQGESLARQLRESVSDMQALIKTSAEPPSRRAFRAIEQALDVAVGVYARDGLHLRQSAEALVETTRLQIHLAVAGSIVAAVIIALVLSHAIVPSIRRAVMIATEIASGKLDNPIDEHGSSETATLLRALATMQRNIAEKIAFIERLMARQASSHVSEIATHNARFETALNHMTLGLRMFDADNVLVVQNQRFSRMFGAPDQEGSKNSLRLLTLDAFDHPQNAGPYHCLLDDGRTIAVSAEPMADGGRVITYEDVTERQRTEERLSHMVRHDALTELPNRVLFREYLQQAMDRRHPGGVTSVLCLDLDRFKTVNDTLGHPVGDELLRQAAGRLLDAADEADMVVRLGGDEFAVIQSRDAPGRDAEDLAAELIDVLSRPFEIDGHRISVGVSIGIAETSDERATPDELLKNADLALYAAKAEGRGMYRVFELEMNARIQARRALEVDLRSAIAEQQFELYYQPIVSARTGAVIAFEALLRWHHPVRGMVSPADFIPVAEETGLIPTIGLWVLNRACLDATRWPGDVKVAVNLSPIQFQYRNLVSDVEDALRRSGLSPARLDLEITESVMLRDSETTLSILHGLRARGIGISMDDFGTGYSSLSYLRCFPFSKIKIDRSFIRDMVDSKDGLAIVRAVIRLGQSLRMSVVAEGVETVEQKKLLCEAGCQELQGFLFGRPKPSVSVEGVIHELSMDRAA